MSNSVLSAKREQFLHDIGLSHDAIALYRLLLSCKSLTAAEAGLELHTFASATYRLFYKLEQWGLVERTEERPVRFVAVAKTPGMLEARKSYDAHLARLIQAPAEPVQDTLEALQGRAPQTEGILKLIGEATAQIRLYTEGVGLTGDVYRALAAAIGRGVHVEYIVRWVRPVDATSVSKLVRLGVVMKQDPSATVQPFALADGTKLIIYFADPHDRTKDVALATPSHGLILLFESHFNQLVTRAKIIR